LIFAAAVFRSSARVWSVDCSVAKALSSELEPDASALVSAMSVSVPNCPTLDWIWSYPAVDAAAQSAQSVPSWVFQAYVKSSALIGVPSFYTASGLIL